MPQLHIRYEGQSVDIDIEDADIGDLSSNTDIKVAASRYLGVNAEKFESFAVDKNEDTGDVTLRPQAVFG